MGSRNTPSYYALVQCWTFTVATQNRVVVHFIGELHNGGVCDIHFIFYAGGTIPNYLLFIRLPVGE